MSSRGQTERLSYAKERLVRMWLLALQPTLVGDQHRHQQLIRNALKRKINCCVPPPTFTGSLIKVDVSIVC
ncbi:hypothetical protein L596_004887 [Steinernema carpocapsae]|uniref:Uncharacterized protein n=1 Tax=Steinernema carpocapsae TaxID=34508 RepID=A0A4U8UY96_STECR|nr:hypothetical protein L596_004887 [Steinernema carpocapsae]